VNLWSLQAAEVQELFHVAIALMILMIIASLQESYFWIISYLIATKLKNTFALFILDKRIYHVHNWKETKSK